MINISASIIDSYKELSNILGEFKSFLNKPDENKDIFNEDCNTDEINDCYENDVEDWIDNIEQKLKKKNKVNERLCFTNYHHNKYFKKNDDSLYYILKRSKKTEFDIYCKDTKYMNNIIDLEEYVDKWMIDNNLKEDDYPYLKYVVKYLLRLLVIHATIKMIRNNQYSKTKSARKI